jgi:hypothetical protein
MTWRVPAGGTVPPAATMQITGALGIAAFGTVYLSLAADGPATHAFAVVTAAFAAIAVLAALLAAGATRPSAVRPRAAPSAGRAPGGAGRT